MKAKVGPVAIGLVAVVLVGFLFLMYRHFFPSLPPDDTSNPKGMPGYAKAAQEFLKNRKPGEQHPGGMPGQPPPGAPGGGR